MAKKDQPYDLLPIAAQAQSRILQVVGACRGCPFNTLSPIQARVHAAAEGHVVAVTKHYLIEPMVQ